MVIAAFDEHSFPWKQDQNIQHDESNELHCTKQRAFGAKVEISWM